LVVHKAVLPVAGLGTRFLPATKVVPKEMMPVVDKPAIQYIVEECVRAGIDDVVFVTSTGKASMEDHFDRRLDLEALLEEKMKDHELALVRGLAELATIHAVRQHVPLGLGHAVLMGAGAFQFSKLKDKCIEECRHPGIYLMRRYKRGVSEAFRLGRGHGLFCLGCCWALMLLMFAVGMANLAWMAVLAAIMAYEKFGRHGRDLTPAVGVTLLIVGLLVLVFVVPLGVS
jgi:hypothetical protein